MSFLNIRNNDLSTRNIACHDSSEQFPNNTNQDFTTDDQGDYTQIASLKKGENLKIRNNKIILCPIFTCKKKYKYAAALENHLIKYHKMEINHGFVKPKEVIPRKEDFPPDQQKVIDNYANFGEFLLPSQSPQEIKTIQIFPEVKYNYLPQNTTQNIKLQSTPLFPEEDLMSYASVVQPLCNCSSCKLTDVFPRAPSPGLKIYSLNESGNRFDTYNYCFE